MRGFCSLDSYRWNLFISCSTVKKSINYRDGHGMVSEYLTWVDAVGRGGVLKPQVYFPQVVM